MAFAVIDAAKEAKLKPGRDVAIVGYDDVPMAGWSGYELTTVSQQVPDMVDATCKKLKDLQAGKTQSGSITLIKPTLIERCSG